MNHVLLPAHDPAEIRLDHRRRFVHVVAVQTHGRLEAQRIARAEAGRHHAGVRQPGAWRPTRVPRSRRDEHLEAVFTR